MNDLYEAFCLTDPVFYDAPGAAPDADGLLGRIVRTLPAGWTTADNGVWLGVHPDGVELPEQGWKVHVAACLDNARRVLTTVWDHCVAERMHFKFLNTPATFIAQNAKYADRSGSGKFITIYPVGDDALERTLRQLGEQLRGEHGPYILSDLRWEDGPLFVRYGGFLLQECRSEQGALVPAIRDPRGRLVPDERMPTFHTPSWVQLPAMLEDARAARDGAPAEPFPYEVTDALHFSNGGGVYVATSRATGKSVVVKEARPFAGLDAQGVDAVERLEREHRILQRLVGLDCVPAVVELRAHWEHRFLVEELIPGATLNEEMVQRHPLIHPSPSDADIAAYTEWALDVIEQLAAAVAAVHARGVVLGDLHTRNVIVRPDGRTCLIDLELAHDVDEPWSQTMGAPGFAAPPGCSGFDVDLHALAAIRLSLFLPYTELLRWDPDKAEELIEAVRRRFPVPLGWAAAVRHGIHVPPPGVDGNAEHGWREHCWPRHGLPRWEALRSSIAAGINASATPERGDRLFPGDPAQFDSGALGLAHGAAGVLWALHETGAEVDPAHLDWLVDAVDRRETVAPGLYDGLAGIAFALDRCGRRSDALSVFARLGRMPLDAGDHSLFGGTAGIGLAHLHLAHITADDRHAQTARQLATSGFAALAERPELHTRAGLLHGWSGLALLAIRLAELDDERWLDRAELALESDLAHCILAADGTMQYDEGWRLLPYVGVGSAGVGVVLDQFLALRPDSRLGVHRHPLQRAATTEAVIQCGLFNGRAGLILFLDGSRPAHTDEVRAHVARLAWHAAPYRGHTGFIGDQLARLSMDLGTGAAGVLLAIGAAMSERPITLPFLRPTPWTSCDDPPLQGRGATPGDPTPRSLAFSRDHERR